MNILETDSVTLSYGTRTVISGGYMKLEGGRIHALIGRNGYGKSSLMKVVFGTQPAEFSFTRYNGKRLQHPYKEQGLIRYLPQFDFLPRSIRLQSFADAYGVPWEKVISCLSSLEGRAKQYVGSLSGGESRMLATVVMICSPVKFVLLDEPFTHIMPLHIDSIKDLIRREAEAGKGFMITDHMYDHVLDLADKFYYMEWGVTREISREELLEKDYFLRMK
ncbi:ATP-binding cassette domain-containing protein [Chitinophaga sp. CF418]|uniref:ATP-binding cassette domain-containing protein n=1 Tax=Chitinophaga sp. CF418 TaxID=1855287 RepID=UPI000917DD6E|nr:ATP-binding cassette domain-containing protein [Chitinophaga sp. CF418]SHN45365.1 ABC-type Mn2+/Zn2+ transport system, ATPase component [Chitinophaga sp. CF418]